MSRMSRTEKLDGDETRGAAAHGHAVRPQAFQQGRLIGRVAFVHQL